MQKIKILIKGKIKRVAVKKLLIDYELDVGSQENINIPLKKNINQSLELDVDINIPITYSFRSIPQGLLCKSFNGLIHYTPGRVYFLQF